MNEETLALYYYNDGLSGAQRREVESALAADPTLARQYQVLCRQLDSLAESESQRAPTHLVQRWHEVINRAAEQEAVIAEPQRSFHFGSFFWGTAVAASLAIGIAIGVYMSGDAIDVIDPGTRFVGIPDVNRATPSAALLRGLLVHFEESRTRLGDLSPLTNGDRQLLIMGIIQQNRLFELAATRSDSQDLARVLRAFEPILLRLAADDISSEDAATLQSQLAFELNIVLTKWSRNLSKETDSIDT